MRPVRAALFDIDGTLTDSGHAPSTETISALQRLMAQLPIALITGMGFGRVNNFFLSHVHGHCTSDNLYVFTDNAATCHLYKDKGWELEYQLAFTESERELIVAEIGRGVREAGITLFENDPIQTRASKVYLMGVSHFADEATKSEWFKQYDKLQLLNKLLNERLPDFEANLGGKFSIDVSKRGINKAYGVRWLSKHLSVPPAEMLFVGDGFFEGGNDAVVIPTGIEWHRTSGPAETMRIITTLMGSTTQSPHAAPLQYS